MQMPEPREQIHASCHECAAVATCALTFFDRERATTMMLCDVCWRRRRPTVGVDMIEGPLAWGTDWPEVLEWLDRSCGEASTPRLRLLVAHELHRQLPHLPRPYPSRARALLAECGYPLTD
jgi:hypothetical protein